MHKNYVYSNHRNIFDYSEYKLRKYIAAVTDQQQKNALSELLDDYRKGRVLIAWSRGLLFYSKVINGK